MLEPTTMSPGSIMPTYPWLFDNTFDQTEIGGKIKAMQTLGVPYEKDYADKAADDMMAQADEIVGRLSEADIEVSNDKEIIALIAYLQRLGKDIKAE